MKNKVLAATYNPVTKSKIFTVMVDVPYCLLPELLQHKELNITYKKIEDITLQEVLDNPYVPIGANQEDINDLQIVNKLWRNCLEGYWYEDGKFNFGVHQHYNDLLLQKIPKQIVNSLLIPFACTTCIITGSNWNEFFELKCPKYKIECSTNGTNIYNSKKQVIKHFDCKNDEPNWESINKSIVQLDLQRIAETIYDLYQEADWKESEYHIPFEEYINEKFTIEELNDYWRKENGYSNTNSVDTYYYVGGASITEEDHIGYLIQISNSMCDNFSKEGTLEYHLNNKQLFIH